MINVNLDEKKIDFALLNNFRKGIQVGKTAKKKAKAAEKLPIFKEQKTVKKAKKNKTQAVKKAKRSAKTSRKK